MEQLPVRKTTQQDYPAISFAGCLAAIGLLLAATIVSLTSGASQEPFETIADAAAYASGLAKAETGLRTILFIDSLFIIAYVTAIGFAVAAFASRCRPAAWLGGLAILAVAILDMLENAIMAQSLDMAVLGASITLERIAWQASLSAMKWQMAALALFSVSFILPDESLLERLLVWGLRLGLPLAVPLFVMDAFGLRQIAPAGLGLTMLGGFILLAVVLRTHLRQT
ncbi:hypothetical protein [Salaquimonas pukyongi]|uniref:hypothetical protein n=1 Tax=Salaquimonas pukyongi TaxID=2712698 RepID=UPI00096B6B34|nr:hypothetical protein [Salaquimonas pukyongi]